MTQVMERSTQQRLDALEKANRIRLYRAARKKDVREGALPPDWFLRYGRLNSDIATMKVFEALIVMPGMGRKKAAKLMARAGVAMSKTLGGTSPAAYCRLRRWLPEVAPGVERSIEMWETRR